MPLKLSWAVNCNFTSLMYQSLLPLVPPITLIVQVGAVLSTFTDNPLDSQATELPMLSVAFQVKLSKISVSVVTVFIIGS